MTHTLRDLLKHKPCRDGIDELLKRKCGGIYVDEAELDMELTVDNIRHCSTSSILWALAHLGRLDIVVSLARYAVDVAEKVTESIDAAVAAHAHAADARAAHAAAAHAAAAAADFAVAAYSDAADARAAHAAAAHAAAAAAAHATDAADAAADATRAAANAAAGAIAARAVRADIHTKLLEMI